MEDGFEDGARGGGVCRVELGECDLDVGGGGMGSVCRGGDYLDVGFLRE